MEILLKILIIYISTRIFNIVVMHTYVKGLLKEISEDYEFIFKKKLVIPVKYDVLIPFYSELKMFNRLMYKDEYKDNMIFEFLCRLYIIPKNKFNLEEKYKNDDCVKHEEIKYNKISNNIDNYENQVNNNQLDEETIVKIKTKIKNK